MRSMIFAAAASLVVAGTAGAQDVPVETGTLGGSSVTLHLQPFLTEEELTTLRLVMTNQQALEIFVPDAAKGFAALALAPDEGFIRDGKPVASAVAIAGLTSADEAKAAALRACDAARKAASACVIVLEVAPAG